MIPYGRQNISEKDIQAVVEVLRSDYLTQGPAVPAFENAVANYCGAQHAVAVNSATSALHIACLALDVGKGDIVWTSPITFVASANCALYCGATVDFVDIDSTTYNICLEQLKIKLEIAKTAKKIPKVVIPVHFSGLPCDMEAIRDLSNQYGFYIIEDASHAIGAKYLDKPVGSCDYSDITVFSFHPVKIITTGEGGMALTNNSILARRMQLLRSHGITRDEKEMTNESDGPWYYEQQILGFNYRMTDMQAALGLSQLDNLDEWVKKRHQIADIYDEKLVQLPVILPKRDNVSYSALHLYVVQVDEVKTSKSRKSVFYALRAAEIGVNVHYIPVHTQPDYRVLGFSKGQFLSSETYYSRCISLPMYSSLTDINQQKVITALSSIFLSES